MCWVYSDRLVFPRDDSTNCLRLDISATVSLSASPCKTSPLNHSLLYTAEQAWTWVGSIHGLGWVV